MKSMASFSRSKERGLKEGLVEIEKRRRELGPRRDIDKNITSLPRDEIYFRWRRNLFSRAKLIRKRYLVGRRKRVRKKVEASTNKRDKESNDN